MANLNKEQAEAVRHKDGPCLCLAGPGSGKTHVLVERIKYLIEEEGIDPRTILVITFSKKAALHMKYRFENSTGNRNYPVCFGTFHAIFYNIVKDYYGLNAESVLTDCYKKLILEKVIKKLNIGELSEEFKASILFNVTACKYDLLLSYKVKSVDEYTENVYSDDKDRNNFAVIYNEYISECKRYRKIDFDDMLYMCRNLLINNKEILAKYQKLYRYILVDEFQDINEVQYEVLDMLAGDNNNVFAVGDDDQSIYGFRGSDPGFMKRFIDENDGTKIINLYKNYRCAKCIVEAAEKLITNNKNRLDKRQKACKKNKEEGFVTIKSFGNENDEAEYVIEEIKKMYSGETSDFAILYRTSKCADALEEKLKLSGINYLRKSDKNSYYDEEWIQDIISYFRVALGDINNKYLFRILNRPNRNILRDDEEKINNLMSKIKVLENMSGYAALMYVLKALEYEKYFYYINECKEIGLNESQKMLKELIMKSKQYYSLRTWIETIDDVYMKKKPGRNETIESSMNYENGNKDNKSNAKIELMTVHASKGLEFDTVFIIGLQEGIFPHRKAISTEEIEEERRLLYVAMTRAKNNLYVIGRGHESHGKRVSAFVSEISEKYSSKEGDFEV